jgi:hypothetical protein
MCLKPGRAKKAIPFGKRLQAYLQGFDSASGSLRKLIDNIYGVEIAQSEKANAIVPETRKAL